MTGFSMLVASKVAAVPNPVAAGVYLAVDPNRVVVEAVHRPVAPILAAGQVLLPMWLRS